MFIGGVYQLIDTLCALDPEGWTRPLPGGTEVYLRSVCVSCEYLIAKFLSCVPLCANIYKHIKKHVIPLQFKKSYAFVWATCCIIELKQHRNAHQIHFAFTRQNCTSRLEICLSSLRMRMLCRYSGWSQSPVPRRKDYLSRQLIQVMTSNPQ